MKISSLNAISSQVPKRVRCLWHVAKMIRSEDLRRSVETAVMHTLSCTLPTPYSISLAVSAAGELADNLLDHADWEGLLAPQMTLWVSEEAPAFIGIRFSNLAKDAEAALRCIQDRLREAQTHESAILAFQRRIRDRRRQGRSATLSDGAGLGLLQIRAGGDCDLSVWKDESEMIHVEAQIPVDAHESH